MNFNKIQFSSILQQAQGSRSLQRFSKDCNVSTSYLSNLIKCKKENPPSIEISIKIANGSHNRVTLETILEACGHSNVNLNNESNSLINYWKDRSLSAEKLCDELTVEVNNLCEKLAQIKKICTI